MLIAVAVVFVIMGLPQAASADTKIVTPIRDCRGNPGEPYKIEMSGQYRLDVNCSVRTGANGIAITASDVYLDLNGHTISGPGSRCFFGDQTSVGIGVGGSNVHIVGGSDVHGNDGTVMGFSIGIQVIGPPAPGVPIEHNHLSGLTLTGNGTGLNLRDSNDNQVSGSKISDNCGDGVVLQNSNHNVIDSNVINRVTINRCGNRK